MNVSNLDRSSLNDEKDANAATSPYLSPYNLHGWKPNPSGFLDENYMDIVMIITRNEHKRQGSMGCIITNLSTDSKPNLKSSSEKELSSDKNITTNNHFKYETTFYNAIIGASTNKSLFKPMDSDIHAEIGALGVCAQDGNSTKGGTVYITMPPCKRCFGALVSAGIQRVVSNKIYATEIEKAAQEKEIELVTMSEEHSDGQKHRLNALLGKRKGVNAQIEQDRKRRKEDRKERKKEGAKREEMQKKIQH